ncbi:MAG TPA: SRPBCC family protein [Oligoflexia bacterium]|nr:SRPBCC family protein [Oligoflexia bacterium]HMR24284.1 SRPBCC family protein [Oligoflexia bacterium]
MKNEIKREIIINASQEKVYDAISNPKKITQWFPETLEGKFEVGEQPIFGFGEDGKNQVYIESASPYSHFSYRWVPGANHFLGDVTKVANTLVTFRIESLGGDRCKVILTETGFSQLPNNVIEKSFKQNSGGWDFMLNRLEQFFDAK